MHRWTDGVATPLSTHESQQVLFLVSFAWQTRSLLAWWYTRVTSLQEHFFWPKPSPLHLWVNLRNVVERRNTPCGLRDVWHTATMVWPWALPLRVDAGAGQQQSSVSCARNMSMSTPATLHTWVLRSPMFGNSLPSGMLTSRCSWPGLRQKRPQRPQAQSWIWLRWRRWNVDAGWGKRKWSRHASSAVDWSCTTMSLHSPRWQMVPASSRQCRTTSSKSLATKQWRVRQVKNLWETSWVVWKGHLARKQPRNYV